MRKLRFCHTYITTRLVKQRVSQPRGVVEPARQPRLHRAPQRVWYAAAPQARERRRVHQMRRRKRHQQPPAALLRLAPTTRIQHGQTRACQLQFSCGLQPALRPMRSAPWQHQAQMCRRAAGRHQEGDSVSHAATQKTQLADCRPGCVAVRATSVKRLQHPLCLQRQIWRNTPSHQVVQPQDAARVQPLHRRLTPPKRS